MTITTRRPTGKPSWPITLAAGMQSAGKTWMAAQASASPLVSRTLWVGFGEKDPDELGAIAGADFEIVHHNGTVRGVIGVLNEIAALPVPKEGPILVVFDSGSRYWDVISENVQAAANKRAKSRDGGDANIGIDLWNKGKGDWQAMLNALRAHRGPSIITARFEEAAVVVNGRPTPEKVWKVKAEKGLPYDVDAVIEMRERGGFTLTKLRSAIMPFDKNRAWAGFTMDAFWRELGLADNETGVAVFAEGIADTDDPEDVSGRDWLADLALCVSADQVAKLGNEAIAAKADKSVTGAIRAKHRTLTPTGTKATD